MIATAVREVEGPRRAAGVGGRGLRSRCIAIGASTGAWAAALVWASLSAGAAANGPEIECKADPSRTDSVHRIPVYDEQGKPIGAADKRPQPLSARVTCGKCHDYRRISRGWHFNAANGRVPPGRPGQCWILADFRTATQIPISSRPWPGTWRPEEVGVTAWRFLGLFGRHYPGGGVGQRYPKDRLDPASRWELSGDLEINCLACHSADRRHDQAAWADHVWRENFRWAATASSGLAAVDGYMRLLPGNYDPQLGDHPDFPGYVPRVRYNAGVFNAKDEVFFDVVRKQPANRCYFCHTNHPTAGKRPPSEWQVDEDVHMARGLTCADCHRNGLDHGISRNYEGERRPGNRGRTCQSCHLGEDGAGNVALQRGGHLAAPRPVHDGLPAVHLEKLTCTACHSGPIPRLRPHRVQTSRAHGLGDHAMAFDPRNPPFLLEPVFIRHADEFGGKIGPHRMVFPSFWARAADGGLQPILPPVVGAAAGKYLSRKLGAPLTAERVAGVLKALAGGQDGEQAAYVCGGKLYRLGDRDALVAAEHERARPYAWPLAHDVRPAAQSLGAAGECTECHSPGSAFFFGKVPPPSPAALRGAGPATMHELAGVGGVYHWLFGSLMLVRPLLKLVGFISAAVIAAVLALYGLRGLGAILERPDRRARLESASDDNG